MSRTLFAAAKQALEALEWCEPDYYENPRGFKKWVAVMPVLREALRLAHPPVKFRKDGKPYEN